MTDWWESAPLAEKPADDWWKAAPVAGAVAPRPEIPNAPLGSVEVGPFAEVSREAVQVAQPHMADDFRAGIGLGPIEKSVAGDLSDMLLRGIMAVPELAGDLVELPANANEAIIRAAGYEPSDTGVFAGSRDLLRSIAGVLGEPAEGMDAIGMGAGSVGTDSLVEALNPSANDNRAQAAAEFGEPGNYDPLTLGDRAGTVGRFALEQAVRSGPEMLAAVASLPGYIGARTNQIAEARAGNDERADVSLTDLLVAAPAATIEGTLERFTTGRLLPGAGGAVAPGVGAAAGRVAREVGVQAPLGGAEEVAAYLGETMGTERGSSGQGTLEAFAGGAVGEGAIGGTAQGAKEVAGAIARRGDRRPSNAIPPLGDPEPSIEPEPDPGTVPPEDGADIEALLVKNLLGADVAEALGIEPEAEIADVATRIREIFGDGETPAPVLDAGRLPPTLDTARLESMLGDTESAPAAPPAATATEVRTSQPAQILTPEQSGQASAPQSAPAGAGADLGRYGNAPGEGWVLRDKETGEPVMETRDRNKVEALNTAKYEAVPVERHLVEINDPSSLAGRWARRDPSADPAPVANPSAPIGEAAPKKRKPAKKRDKANKPMDLLRVIAANGGLNREAFRAQGVDPSELTRRAGFNYVFRKKGGMSLSDLREFMQQEGYLPRDPEDGTPVVGDDDAMQMFDRAFRSGEEVFADDQADDVNAYRLAKREADEAYQAEWEAAHAEQDDSDPFAVEVDNAYAQDVAALTEQAYDLGARDEDIIDSTWEGDRRDNLRQLIARLQDETDPEAGEGDSAGRAEARQETEPAPGFTLGAPPAEAPRREVAPSQGAGLFGAPTARDFIDARTRERDDARNGRTGTGRTDMLAGDGELFAGDRPAQASVDDFDTEPTTAQQAALPDDTPSHIASMGQGARDTFGVEDAAKRRHKPGNWTITEDAGPNELTPEGAIHQLAIYDTSVSNLNGKFIGRSRGASTKELINAWVSQGQLRTAIEQSRNDAPAMWAAYDDRQNEVSNLSAGDRVRLPVGPGEHFGTIERKFKKNWRIRSDGGVSLYPPSALAPAATPQRQPASEGLESVEDVTATPEFKRWSQGAPVVDDMADYEGGPAVFRLIHGTTANFDSFDRERANIESDFGAGFYFTNNPADVSENYAGLGPDLTNKIEREAERIAADRDLDYSDPEVIAEARARWMQNEGSSMPVFVRALSPAIVGGDNETVLTFDEPYNEELDEYGEPEGTLLPVLEALREIEADGQFGDFDAEKVIADIFGEHWDGDSIGLNDMIGQMKGSEGLVYAQDNDSGDLASSEIIRQVLERAGFDAVVDYTVDIKFGSQRATGQKMAGMSDDTVHVIAFQPTQVKSSIGNRGTFDPDNPSILANEEPGTDSVPTNTAFESLQQGEADAEMLGLRAAVNKVLGEEHGNKVVYLHGRAGLPDRLNRGVQSRTEDRKGTGRTAALYDPVEKQVYIFTDVVTEPDRAVWNAVHEFGGHHGLRTLLGDRLDHALQIALQNPTVKALADAIYAERRYENAVKDGKATETRKRLEAAEEALAELAAAVRTGNYDAIESRYNVPVPEGIRARVERAIENFLRRLKALMDDLFGRPVFTDEDVRALLESAWQAANGEAAAQTPRRAYAGVPDSLMGFPRDKPGKPFEDQRYRYTGYYRFTYEDGQTGTDAVKGLNRAHALERARRNWSGAVVTEATKAEFDADEAALEAAWSAANGNNADMAPLDGLRDTVIEAPDGFVATPIAAPRAGEAWYHGRPTGERTFADGRPTFFARDRAGAEWYAQDDSGSVSTHTVQARNPARIRDLQETLQGMGYRMGDEVDDRLADEIAAHSPYGGENLIDAIYVPAVRQSLADKGFDSLLAHDTIESGSTEALVVWDAAQIDPEGGSATESTAPDQAQTPEFRRWFDKGGLRDENGAPKVLYHVTTEGFDAFKPSRNGYFGPGIYLWDSIDKANAHADSMTRNPYRPIPADKGPAIVPVYARNASGPHRDPVMGPGQYVVSKSSDVKSAIANRGTFAPESDSILEAVEPSDTAKRAANNITKRQAAAKQRREDAADTLGVETGERGPWDFPKELWHTPQGVKGRFRTGGKQGVGLNRHVRAEYQDKMIAFRDVQRAIEKAKGAELAAMQNVYQMENLMHGRVMEGFKQYEEARLEPLAKAMHKAGLDMSTGGKLATLAGGPDLTELEAYLWARHAKERNAAIAEKNPKMPDGGSGMSNATADKVLAAADTATLEPLAKMVDRITRETRKRLLNHGIITQAQHDAMAAQYEGFVPLRGQTLEADQEFTNAGVGAGGIGLDGRGKVVREAMGRGEGNPPVSILGEVIRDAQASIIQAEKARVGRSLMRLVLANPNPMWSVEPVNTERAVDANGEVYERVANDAADPSVVHVRLHGDLYKVQLNAPLAKAFAHVGVDQMTQLTRVAGKINRYFSAIYTKYNPYFIARNGVRDMIFGMTGLIAEHGELTALKAAMAYPAAARAAYRYARGKPPKGELGRRYKEYIEDGGKTGWVSSRSAEDLARGLGGGMTGYDPQGIKKAARVVGDFIGDANDAVESALRFAAYTTLRDRGVPRQKSAFYSKELTVNFNRKGFSGSSINAWLIFFNPAMQGSKRFIDLARNKKAMGYMMGLAGIQAVAMMAAMGDDDEEGEPIANLIPEYLWKRNLVIVVNPEDARRAIAAGEVEGDNLAGVITIPMPYGVNVLTYGAGRIVRGFMSEEARPEDSAAGVTSDILSAAVQGVVPVPIGEGASGLIHPLLGIFADIHANKNYFGSAIHSKYADKSVPLAQQGRPDTLEIYKLAAKALNRAGGGDEVTPATFSWLNVAPEDVEYVTNELLGGPLRFVSDMATMTGKAFDPNADMDPRDIPVLNSFYTNVDREAAQQSLYYNRKDAIERAAARVNLAFQRDGFEAAQSLLGATPELKGATIKRLNATSQPEAEVRAAGERGGLAAARAELRKHPELAGVEVRMRGDKVALFGLSDAEDRGRGKGPPRLSSAGNLQFGVRSEDSVYALFKAAQKAVSERNSAVRAIYAEHPATAASLLTGSGRKREAAIREADRERAGAQERFNDAYVRQVVGAAE